MKHIRTKYICDGCDSLYDTGDDAALCCPADQVFLCGKVSRGRYATRPCIHFDEADARRCQQTDKRKKAQ